jgi:hypothetical protein
MTYKFEQFNTEITDPTVTALVNTIRVQPEFNTIAVSIDLETENSKLYGVELTDIAVSNLSYEGYENLMLRVNEKLLEYVV